MSSDIPVSHAEPASPATGPEARQQIAPRAFEPLPLTNIELPNRLVRAATYEGMADHEGMPRPILGELYARLAEGGVGTIITGFAYVSPEGRAMQTRQCGIESDERIAPWRSVLTSARETGGNARFFLQLAHTGRQTRRSVTRLPVLGVSSRRCSYFRQKVHPMTDREVRDTIAAFGKAAWRAREAGFDGVQVHAAHGYLIHQFLSPWTNRRKDGWRDRTWFLDGVLAAVRQQCGESFPVLVKLSASDDNTPGIRLEDTIETVRRIEKFGVDAVEITYGTMEYALNIIRGDCPAAVALRVNPLFSEMPAAIRWLWTRFGMKSYIRKFIPFTESYNLRAASVVRRETGLPTIVVGGVRSGTGVQACLDAGVDAVSLCRPLICEPDFPRRLSEDSDAASSCTNCNLCTIYCDSDRPLQCYRKKEVRHENA
jgi:2,4-dienoyl-CoA reductase-like NADH-dependent reductase (Old Yellow Enzyme family)